VPGPHSALVGAYRLAARHVMSAEIGGTTAASCVRSRAGGATGSRPVAALCGRSADNRVLRQRPAAGCGGCFGGGAGSAVDWCALRASIAETAVASGTGPVGGHPATQAVSGRKRWDFDAQVLVAVGLSERFVMASWVNDSLVGFWRR
jgi:hypothetical protein